MKRQRRYDIDWFKIKGFLIGIGGVSSDGAINLKIHLGKWCLAFETSLVPNGFHMLPCRCEVNGRGSINYEIGCKKHDPRMPGYEYGDY